MVKVVTHLLEIKTSSPQAEPRLSLRHAESEHADVLGVGSQVPDGLEL